ncbi:hypothetical protein PSHT_01269 [Puccinia striiformis]|uniref:Uncharacterized protein n=1 Tax=Puccinia striiformis TaxID=27350 RepID=A0A2S4WKW8_9BASI|nr:hypothetical protein PSHT_01269 [Puccinia striiformis]
MKAFIFLLAFLQSFEARQIWANDPAFLPSASTSTFQSRVHSSTPLQYRWMPGSSGGSITPLLAMKPPCDQQDYADKVIDAALDKTNGITSEDVRKKLIEVAIKYRLAERNSKPQYWPVVVGRGSLYCQKAPRHPQLKGLVQKQDPANNKTLFFDPAKISINDGTVLLGSQPDTRPFEGGGQDQKGLESSGDPAPGSDVTPKDTSTTGTEQKSGTDLTKTGEQSQTDASKTGGQSQTQTGGSNNSNSGAQDQKALDANGEQQDSKNGQKTDTSTTGDKSDALKNGQKTDTSNTGDQTDASKNGQKTDTSTGGANEAKTTGDNGLGGKQTGSSNGQQEQKSLIRLKAKILPPLDHNSLLPKTKTRELRITIPTLVVPRKNQYRQHQIRRHWICQRTRRESVDPNGAGGGSTSGGTELGGTKTGSSNGQQEEKSLDQSPTDKTPSPGEQLDSTDNQNKGGGGAKTDSPKPNPGMHRRLKTQADNTKPGDTGSANQQEQKSVDSNGNGGAGAGGTGSGGTALGGTQTGTSNGQQEEKKQLESTDNQAKPGEALKTDSQTDNTKPGDTGSANGQTGGGVQEQKSLDTSGAGNGSGTQTGTDPKDASKEEKTVDSNGSEDNCSANGNEENTESTDPKPTTTTTDTSSLKTTSTDNGTQQTDTTPKTDAPADEGQKLPAWTPNRTPTPVPNPLHF